jgi:tetratricopeptide (TPR) repeat protein
VAELPDDLYARITALSERGEELHDDGETEGALIAFREALALIPEPPEDWEAATWLLIAIGDVLFLAQRYEEALEPLQDAVFCPGGLGTPFLHLRLGQVQYELRNTHRAKDELARAFMGGGDEIFETEDPKYWRFIREILRPPIDETGQYRPTCKASRRTMRSS